MHTFSPPLIAVSTLTTLLFGCGGSDDSDSDYNSAYVQFYNASPNSATVTITDEDSASFGSAPFADVTTLYSVDSTDYVFEFTRTDADDQEVEIDTQDMYLSQGDKHLVVLSGDFAEPRFTQFSFTRESMDDHFRLMALSVTAIASGYDIYLAEAGQPFEAANFLGTIEHEAMSEYEYWAGDDDSEHFDEGEYTVYLTTQGGTEVIFESPTIDFQYDTEYVLAVRDLGGAFDGGIALDIILNSSTLTSVSDVDATSQYRVYNSTNFDSGINYSLDGVADTDSVAVAEGEATDFIQIEFGDYQLNVTSSDITDSLENQLVTLNQGESKAIVLYYDGSELRATTFEESGNPASYDKTINFVNTVSDYDAVDFYLVRKDETIDTAEYKVSNVEFGEADSDTVPADYYEIIAVYQEGDETLLLDRTELTGLDEDANYIISLEPTDLENDYEIVIVK